MRKKVSVIGLGYVGLPTLVAIVKTDQYDLVGYDIVENKIDALKEGISPIEDKDVEAFLKTDHDVLFTSSEIGLKNTDIFILCVPTPVDHDYVPDYSIVLSAAKTVAPYLKKGAHFVLESTVNPGTCSELVIPPLERETGMKAGVDFNVAHCPERINPGDPKWNIYNIPRNIGSVSKEMNTEIADFYRSFVDAKVNEVSSLEVAEATKIVENTFRDINIAFVNELAMSFDAMGVDLIETLQGASSKPFGFMPHWPGAGVGGHCIAVDPYYLIRRAAKSGFDHRFLKLAREINNGMPEYTVEKLAEALNEIGLSLKGTKIALLGLSYKPDVGDIRESPALIIREILKEKGAVVTAYDPYIDEGASSLHEAIENAEAVLITTAHSDIVEGLPVLLEDSNAKVVVDGRNCLNPLDVPDKIIYKGIGR